MTHWSACVLALLGSVGTNKGGINSSLLYSDDAESLCDKGYCLHRCLRELQVMVFSKRLLDLNKRDGLFPHRSRNWGRLTCNANHSACWRNKSAADARQILFWQVNYCCNNIRLVLLMQTACTDWSLACVRVSAVHHVLNWVDTVVQAGWASPFPASLLSYLISPPPHTSFLSFQLLLWLPFSSNCSHVTFILLQL